MAESQAVTRSQRILGGAEDDPVERVRAVMVAFERMWGGLKVLAENHPARQGRKYLPVYLAQQKVAH